MFLTKQYADANVAPAGLSHVVDCFKGAGTNNNINLHRETFVVLRIPLSNGRRFHMDLSSGSTHRPEIPPLTGRK